MSNQAARPSAWEAIRPVVVLVVICMVAGALLGVVHDVTDPIAQANAEQKAQEVYASLVPKAAQFEQLDCDVEGCTAALRALDSSGSELAYVIVAQSKGYGGQVPIAVAFDPASDTVLSIIAMDNEETPGLGTKISAESYIGQYVGLATDEADSDNIDLISGATISSRAAFVAFGIAVEAYEEVR